MSDTEIDAFLVELEKHDCELQVIPTGLNLIAKGGGRVPAHLMQTVAEHGEEICLRLILLTLSPEFREVGDRCVVILLEAGFTPEQAWETFRKNVPCDDLPAAKALLQLLQKTPPEPPTGETAH